MDDSFRTIASPAAGLYRDKGSRFLSFAYPVENVDHVRAALEALRREYFDARHHCYAWRMGADGNNTRTADDGEPAGTAGRPILGQIVAARLTNILVVVVRYFGGILLGTGGLVQAYKQATADALANAVVTEGIVSEHFRFRFSYTDMDRIMKTLREMGAECYEQQFELDCTMFVKLRKGLVLQMRERLSRVESLKIEDKP